MEFENLQSKLFYLVVKWNSYKLKTDNNDISFIDPNSWAPLRLEKVKTTLLLVLEIGYILFYNI